MASALQDDSDPRAEGFYSARQSRVYGDDNPLPARISNRDLIRNNLAHFGLFFAVVVVGVHGHFCHANAPKLTEALPPSTANGILRVGALILLCIGIHIAWRAEQNDVSPSVGKNFDHLTRVYRTD